MNTVIAYLRARALVTQPAPVTYVHYPNREGSKGDGLPWVCLAKAAWVAEKTLGRRQSAVAERFVEFLQDVSVQVLEHSQLR